MSNCLFGKITPPSVPKLSPLKTWSLVSVLFFQREEIGRKAPCEVICGSQPRPGASCSTLHPSPIPPDHALSLWQNALSRHSPFDENLPPGNVRARGLVDCFRLARGFLDYFTRSNLYGGFVTCSEPMLGCRRHLSWSF